MEKGKDHRIQSRFISAGKIGNKKVFREFFEWYYPKLIHFAAVFLPTIQASEEVVSDVFYKILKNPNLLDNIGDLDHYMFFAVRNQSFTWLKANKNQQIFESIDSRADYLVPSREDPEQVFIDRELYRLLRQTIDQLPPKRRTVFILVKEEGMKYKEVAELLDISLKTVEMQMSQALATIREAILHYLESRDIKVKHLPKSGFLSIFFTLL